jgi:hypothetical protein
LFDFQKNLIVPTIQNLLMDCYFSMDSRLRGCRKRSKSKQGSIVSA